MIITHRINMDLECRGTMPQIEAVQDDRYTRDIAITLTAGGAEWTPPVGAGIVVRYQKPDGNGGKYDTMPDGSAACTVSGNVVTVSLVPQMLTVVGAVPVTVGFVYGDQQISTFGFLINVRPNVGAQIAESEPYLNVRYFLPQPEQAVQGQYLQVERINERGVVTQVKAISGPATPVKGVDYFTEAELTAVAEDAADLVTPGMIGAAPAGFGLGELIGGACTDCNTAVKNGWYNITGSTTNPPVVNSVTHNVAVMLVMGRSSRIWQTVYSYTNTVHAVLQRTSFDSGASWNDWEWVHPPMTVGVEYRTTERWQGKAVYTKLVNFGEVPVDSSKSISYSLGATNIVDGLVIMNGNTILPYDYYGVSVKVNNILTTGARITGAGNSAGSTAVIKLKYTKD